MDTTDDELRMHGTLTRPAGRNLGGQSAGELVQIQRAITAGVRQGIRDASYCRRAQQGVASCGARIWQWFGSQLKAIDY